MKFTIKNIINFDHKISFMEKRIFYKLSIRLCYVLTIQTGKRIEFLL